MGTATDGGKGFKKKDKGKWREAVSFTKQYT